MKFSFKKLFTTNNVINFFYILFLIGIVYALFSSKLVLEGMCSKQKTKTKCENHSSRNCLWKKKIVDGINVYYCINKR
jgi:hypothetical protein